MKRTSSTHANRSEAKPPRDTRSLRMAKQDAEHCERCDLWKSATQTVFGSGPKNARIMLVGEQPGDVEDREGLPFVGPAGRVLREALTRAGMSVEDLYLTNAVKHFKWRPQGKRRIHERPNHEEVLACRLWLDLEIRNVHPAIVVALGATAARALLGPSVRVTRDRTRPFAASFAPLVTLTVHPSSILRSINSEARAAALDHFTEDLRTISRWLKHPPVPSDQSAQI
jgi:uracil-DNA glycosylase family protein